MPQSLHKILIHGPEIIESLVLPIDLSSEETQESRNKDSRTKTNEDVMKRPICIPDPVISSNRKTVSSTHTKCKQTNEYFVAF